MPRPLDGSALQKKLKLLLDSCRSAVDSIEQGVKRTHAACDTTPAQRVTRSLLGYGIIAGPIYVTTSVVQALAHDGFDLSRHAWSQLAAGPQGWIQMANLILTGAMVIAFAVGLRRWGPSRWAPRLITTFGLGLVAAGQLVADPGLGYPVGVATPATPTWPAPSRVPVRAGLLGGPGSPASASPSRSSASAAAQPARPSCCPSSLPLSPFGYGWPQWRCTPTAP